MQVFSRFFLLAFAIVNIGVFAGCESEADEPSKEGTFSTATQTIGNGTVKAWVKRDADGNPTAVGITLDDDALKNLPQDTAGVNHDSLSHVFVMPAEASSTGITHATFDWNPKGHAPEILYSKAHFDVHFYLISEAERMNIMPGVDPVSVEAQYMPADYFTPVREIVPMMGVHYVDTTDLNNSPGGFEKTFVYGFLGGDMIFLEPMMTKAFLESKANFSANLKLPQAYKRTGIYYPTKYSITYDATTKEHTIALEGFVKR